MSGRAPVSWLRLARSATLAILIGGLTTCDSSERSGPEQQLGIAFTFDRPTFGIIDVASVRIVVTRVRDAETFATECEIHQDTDGQIVECELVVGLATAVESFELRVTILDQAGNPVYENLGVQTFDVARGDPVVVVNVPLAYVGPGAGAAEVRILTTDPRVPPNGTVTLTAVALDSSGGVMPGVPIGWVALDPTVTIPNVREGVVVAGAAEGVARVVAYLPTVPLSATPPAGHADTITVTVEAAREVKFATASQTVSEGIGTASIAVQLSSPATLPVTVPFTVGGTATSGTDYTITASPLTIAAGATTGTITVTVVNDAVAEPDETVIVTLGTPTNATLGTPATHTLTIQGQTPSVSFTAASQTVSEGVGTATITARLSSQSAQVVTVPFTVGGTATSGTDYTITASPLTIAAGSTTGTITVTVVNDAVAEPDETVIVTLGTPTNATLGTPATHTLTIAAQVPSVSFTAASQTVSEGIGTASIAVQLSSPSTLPVTVPFTVGGTATSGTDYTITASPLTIAAGSTTGTITVTVVNDTVAEPDETVIVTLGTPTNATLGTPATYTLTIAAQHPPVLSSITYVQPSGINNCTTSGGSLGTYFMMSWSYSDAGGDVRSGATTLVNYVFSDGTAGSYDGTPWTRIGGDGYTGTMQSDGCVYFGGTTYVEDSFRVTDLAGYQSQPITVRILKPAGAN